MKEDSFKKKEVEWSKFAGLASQWAVALVLLLFLGKYLDEHHFFKIKTPIFIWLLPFIFILISLVRIIKDTGSTRKE